MVVSHESDGSTSCDIGGIGDGVPVLGVQIRFGRDRAECHPLVSDLRGSVPEVLAVHGDLVALIDEAGADFVDRFRRYLIYMSGYRLRQCGFAAVPCQLHVIYWRYPNYSYLMFETGPARIVLVCLLLIGQAALFPLYAVQPVNEDAWVLADETEFLDDSDRYLDGPVESGGIVQDTDPVVIRVDTREGTERVTIIGATIEPGPGDKVRVYGTLVEPATIDAHTAFVVPQQGR